MEKWKKSLGRKRSKEEIRGVESEWKKKILYIYFINNYPKSY